MTGMTDRQLQFISIVKEALTEDLPGWKAQKVMSPINHQVNPSPSSSATKAGVMLLLQPHNDGFNIIYIKRGSKYGSDKHKGQISFPGGKLEETDQHLLDCALRETEEEIGIDRKQIKVLGALSQFFVFISGFIVSPFVGVIPHGLTFSPDPDEVEYVIQASLRDLLDPSSVQYRSHKFGERIIEKSPYFDIGNDEKLWGATAMMTNEFLSILKSKGL
jgi:8-oxo-dGTP pyrophosphatase MutT (NUDIX family)